MALFKTRPEVRLSLDGGLVTGEIGTYLVTLECPRPVVVRAVRLTVYGEVCWEHPQEGRGRGCSRFINQELSLLDAPTELDEGPHRFRAKVQLPSGIPGSWTGRALRVRYGAEVRVEIPWWLDRKIRFDLGVAEGQRTRPEPEPRAQVYVTNAGGPSIHQPYLEVSLGQHSFSPGQVLRANAALGNTHALRYEQLEVTIFARERTPLPFGADNTYEHHVARWTVPLHEGSDVGELQPIPFKLEIPDSVRPGFKIHRCSLSWHLRVRAHVPRTFDPTLDIPITVLTRTPDRGSSEAIPLAVGADRLHLIWGAVAQATQTQLVGGRLLGRVGKLEVVVERNSPKRGGRARVFGIVRFPALGVGLEAQRTLRSLLWSTHSYDLRTRDPAQTAVVQSEIGPLLDDNYTLVEVSDQHLRLVLPGTGLQLEKLQAFVEFLGELCVALQEVEALLPPAKVLLPYVEAWRSAAQVGRATLRLADLQLEFQRDGQRLTLGWEFEPTLPESPARLRATRIELFPGQSIPSRMCLSWSGHTALPEHEWPLDALVTPPGWAAPPARVSLQIETHSVRLFLPAPLADPRDELDRIEQLFALGRRIRGETGPYR